MTDKAYIVDNEQQEREVLYRLEQEDLTWWGGDKLTKWTPSRVLHVEFPYILLAQETFVTWSRIDEVGDFEKYEIVFDGRKEEQMSEKYVVSQAFMNELEEWKETLRLDNVSFIGCRTISNLPTLLDNWWRDGSVSVYESNNRLIAIIRWVNGEDVFEVEKPKKWVVRSKETDEHSCYWYTKMVNNLTYFVFYINDATRFDTKEEAESWANAHQEVVEVEA